jgi:hypothetical protein
MVCGVKDQGRQTVSVAKNVHVGHDFAESEVCVFMDNGADR